MSGSDSVLGMAVEMQKQLFSKQHEELSGIVNWMKATVENSSAPTFLKTDDLVLPDILSRRTVPDDLQIQRRLVDNEELTLLSILDADGKISSIPRLTEFIILMTRVVKLEHRALCLYVLWSCLTTECALHFVSMAGFKLLRQWIKVAEEDDCVDELRSIIAICKHLPFESKAVKDSEIGKIIKKLLKHRSAVHDVSPLHDDVRSLMTLWTNQVNSSATGNLTAGLSNKHSIDSKAVSTSPANANTQKDHNSDQPTTKTSYASTATSAIRPIAVTLREKLQAENIKEISLSTHTPGSIEWKQNLGTSNLSNSEEIESVAAVGAGMQAVPSSSFSGKAVAGSQPSSNQIGQQSAISLNSNGLTLNIIKPGSGGQRPLSLGSTSSLIGDSHSGSALRSLSGNRDRRVDMAAEARKQIALQAQAQQLSFKVDDQTVLATQIDAVNTPRIVNKFGSGLQPKSSCLKRKGTSGGEPAAKQHKGGIQWADEHGANLKEVFTFEVEKLRIAVASYKTHKDLVKKERQLEKDVHLSKINDTMQPTIVWKQPTPVSLSIDILDLLNVPVTSVFKEAQSKRIAHTLESRYLDDSLIPMDPDDLANAHEAAVIKPADLPETLIIIPWYAAGSEPELSEPEYADTEDAFAQSLPEILRHLDPAFLKMLTSDESYLLSILNTDGTINPLKLENLKAHFYNSQYQQQSERPTMHENGYSSVSGVYHNSYSQSTGPLLAQHQQPAPRIMPTLDSQVLSLSSSHYSDFSGASMAYKTHSDTQRHPIIPALDPYSSQARQHQASMPSQSHDYEYKNLALPAQFGAASAPSNSQPRSAYSKAGKKASTPCRFYNTKSGCQFGDKCEFGHFGAAPGGGIASTGSGVSGPGRHRGPGASNSYGWGGGGR